jgi:hypothetical protein
MFYATAAMEAAKKFYVFHQRYVGKSANIDEGGSPAEEAVIATSHPKGDPSVMRKAIRKSINQAARQANSKVTANNIWIVHDAPHLTEASPRDFSVNMDKPKDLLTRGACAGVHLHGTTALALDKLITKSGGEPICAIGASAVGNDNFRFRRSLAQMLEKRPYQQRLIEHRNNNRELHSNRFSRSSSSGDHVNFRLALPRNFGAWLKSSAFAIRLVRK